MKSRAEPFGAWVRFDEPAALVAVDRDAARRIGIDGGALWEDASGHVRPPIEVHLAVTSRCAAGCVGCYLDARPDGHAPSFEELTARIDRLADAGVFTVAFGGGEPLTRGDLGTLADHARARGLSPVTTTSGLGMTAARAQSLRAFDQVNVSYDGEGDDYARVRGFDGARVAERAITLLARAGVRVGINVVLTRSTFAHAEAAVRRAVSLGACEVQLLRLKPAGRAASLAYYDARLTDEQARGVYGMLERIVASGVSARIDCAMLPYLSPHLTSADLLERYGIFGCEAGRHLAAVRVDGKVAPCSFAPATSLDVAALADAHLLAADPSLAGFRDHAASAPEPCASCVLRTVCRGGCRIVATYAGDANGPDPECPQVVSYRAMQP